MNKTIITVVGKDGIGIIASVCTFLSSHKVNILDITQSIVSGYFNMMMVASTDDLDIDFADLCHGLDELGEKIGVQIHCQRSDIFDKMHRI